MATVTAAIRVKLAQLHPDLRVRVEALILASPHAIGITSAWRSSARQAELYAGWKARRPGYNPANPPGTSKHERELNGRPAAEAADLAYSSDAAQRWAHAHGAEFGLHFPIRREDWHAESNGRPFRQPAPDTPASTTPPPASTTRPEAPEMFRLLQSVDPGRRMFAVSGARIVYLTGERLAAFRAAGLLVNPDAPDDVNDVEVREIEQALA